MFILLFILSCLWWPNTKYFLQKGGIFKLSKWKSFFKPFTPYCSFRPINLLCTSSTHHGLSLKPKHMTMNQVQLSDVLSLLNYCNRISNSCMLKQTMFKSRKLKHREFLLKNKLHIALIVNNHTRMKIREKDVLSILTLLFCIPRKTNSLTNRQCTCTCMLCTMQVLCTCLKHNFILTF